VGAINTRKLKLNNGLLKQNTQTQNRKCTNTLILALPPEGCKAPVTKHLSKENAIYHQS
jgi:hypothetical protein